MDHAWHDAQNISVDCCRHNNLVYARTLKCGSEFFYRNFTENFYWKPIKFSEIDWHNDTVFSYVMDPIKRRHKGIGEFVVATGTGYLLQHHTGFVKTIATVPYLDDHSASLHNIYREFVNKINWLLIDDDHQVAIHQTEQLLKTHGISDLVWNYQYVHRTDNYLKDIFSRIEFLWEQSTIPHYVMSYFQPNIELFLKIKKSYYGSCS
jgi:hypothetical protein